MVTRTLLCDIRTYLVVLNMLRSEKQGEVTKPFYRQDLRHKFKLVPFCRLCIRSYQIGSKLTSHNGSKEPK